LIFLSLAIPALLLVVTTSVALLISADWRFSIILLVIQYIGVFILVATTWPLEMAVAKLIAGWIFCAVLGMAVIGLPRTVTYQRQPPASRLFRLLAATLVGLTVVSIAPAVMGGILGIGPAQALGSFILIGMGILQLGLTGQPLPTILGLLTALSGFEILYATIESSLLVAGLLAAVNLGLALIGAYVLLAPQMAETE